MAAHPDIGGYGELLLPLRPGIDGWSNWPPGADDRPFYTTYLRERGLHNSHLRRHLELFRYLDYVYGSPRSVRAIGFKLMYDRLRPYPEILVYLRRRSVRVLHLIRENVLDIFLSREARAKRSAAHARSPADLEEVSVRVDTATLISHLTRLRLEQKVARRLLAALHLQAYEFSYEAALVDDAILSNALAFVGIPGVLGGSLPPVMLKLAPLSHREGIANFDDVARTLAGTRFAGLVRP